MNKKRILISLMCITLTLSLVLITNKKDKKSVETVSMPVTGKVIILDARTWKTR